MYNVLYIQKTHHDLFLSGPILHRKCSVRNKMFGFALALNLNLHSGSCLVVLLNLTPNIVRNVRNRTVASLPQFEQLLPISGATGTHAFNPLAPLLYHLFHLHHLHHHKFHLGPSRSYLSQAGFLCLMAVIGAVLLLLIPQQCAFQPPQETMRWMSIRPSGHLPPGNANILKFYSMTMTVATMTLRLTIFLSILTSFPHLLIQILRYFLHPRHPQIPWQSVFLNDKNFEDPLSSRQISTKQTLPISLALTWFSLWHVDPDDGCALTHCRGGGSCGDAWKYRSLALVECNAAAIRVLEKKTSRVLRFIEEKKRTIRTWG